MSESTTSKHVVVIGAGPGGYAGAFRAADLGMSVTLIDPAANPGGVCLYRGCIPSKSLLHVAKLLNETKEAEAWGISFGEPKVDINKLREWKDGVISKLTGGLGGLSKARKINYVRGTATFLSGTSIEITKEDGSTETTDFDFAILASGSRPTTRPAVDMSSDRIMDSTKALALPDIPERLLVVGGGYIGLELAAVYSALGSKVSVVEMLSTLIAGADPDVAKFLLDSLGPRLDRIMAQTRVVKVDEHKKGLTVTMDGPDGEFTEDYDKILVSIGRRPNTEKVGLENTAIKLDERGFIENDDQCRTAEHTIFAIGDVAGNPMLAHKATHEAHVAAEVIAGHKVRFAPNAIPAVVYTDPEVAWVGITETEAKEQGVDYIAQSFPWAASGRAQAMDRAEGMTKMLCNPETRAILGVSIVGAGAGELIGEAALAVEMGALADDVALTIHPHPTMTESVMEVAEMIVGHSDHFYRPKRKK